MKGRTGKKSQVVKPVHMGDPDIRMDKPMKQGGKIDGKKSKARADKRVRGGGIEIKKSHKGLLHKDTNTPEAKKIPEAKIKKAENSKDPAVRKRAVFAENAKHWNKG